MLLSDRICLMNNARVEQLDVPLALYERPATRFSATFLGDSNILEGVAQGAAIRVGGLTLATTHADRLPADGEPVGLMIRPERIRLVAASRGIPARIETVIDLGNTRRISVIAGEGLALNVVTMGGGSCPSPGEQMELEIPAVDVVPLAAVGVA